MFTFLRRALCHDHLNEHDNAVKDWTALCAQDPHNGDLTFYVFVFVFIFVFVLCLCFVTQCCVYLCVFVRDWTALCAQNPNNGDIPSSVCVCVYVCVCICFCICIFLID